MESRSFPPQETRTMFSGGPSTISPGKQNCTREHFTFRRNAYVFILVCVHSVLFKPLRLQDVSQTISERPRLWKRYASILVLGDRERRVRRITDLVVQTKGTIASCATCISQVHFYDAIHMLRFCCLLFVRR